MADGEGEGDPRESNGQDTNSQSDNYHHNGQESNGYGTNGTGSSEEEDDGPLDFSVRKVTTTIPVQNLNNKLTNGLYRSSHVRNHQHHHYNHTTDRSSPTPQGLGDLSETPELRPIKTESVSPPAGLSPGSDYSRVTSADSAGEKIGEPQIALPGMLPGALLPGAAAAGLLPMIPPGLLPTSGMFNGIPVPQELNGTKQQNGKRPFKAYNKDQINLPAPFGALSALPQLPGLDMLTAQALSANSEEAFKQYKQYVSALQEQLSAAQKSPGGSSTSSSQGVTYSGGSMSGMHSPDSGKEGSGGGTPIPPTTWSTPKSTSTTPTFTVPTSPESTVRLPFGSGRHGSQPRKRGRSLPEEQKDDAYWERRRKNNEAAKRSRDSRRAKEDQIAIRAAFLEQENLKLRVEVTALKNETAKLRCMLYNS